ncbi:hypothetical protein EsDP_00006814 [Epichloe bromicola]|uniref:Tetratricopeptide repeat domain-containing protein n=1 Tax=Epichloe bromicola TaxID=79588 RepID=A0ABQ0CYS6_9HYPO
MVWSKKRTASLNSIVAYRKSSIVLVPGIGTNSPENWPFANREWLATLPGSGAGARILTFQYASPFAGTMPSWESILMTGYDLLQHLGDTRSQSDQDLFTRYGSIINAIAGVIFLSTPHRYGDKTTCFLRFRDILEATTGKKLKIPNGNIEQEGAILLDLADRFEGISFLIGLNLNHHDTCVFTESVGGEGLPKFNEFVYETLHDAVRLVALRLEDHILERLTTELLPLKNIVTGSSTALRQFALCGFGGIGKTEIAREFSRRHKSSFDAVFWVVADEIAKLDHHYQQISLTLGLEDPSECKSQVVSREIVKGWLSNSRKYLSGTDDLVQPGQASSEATWLLIFDNADDPMILADYWHQGTGSILITSRDPLAKSVFTRRSSGLDLGPLSQQDSMSLFNQLTTSLNEPEDNAARQISYALGGFPLAISQMAGIIRRQDLTLSEFLELYADHEEHANLYETKFDTNLVTYRHSLSTVWALEKLKSQARQLLELVSFLDPDVIGEDLLMEASAKFFSDGAQFRKSSYIEARADLLQSSLVQRDKKKQQITVHRMVQDAVMATMDVTKKRLIFDQVVRILWANWPAAMPKPSKKPELPQPKSTGGRLHVGRWPLCAAIYPHILRTHQLWPTIPNVPEATSLLFAKLLNEAAWYQKERGRTKQFDGFFETAQSICDSSTHADRDSLLADIHFCLGAIAMDASDFDTSRIHKERSLDLVSKICRELGIADERLYLAYAERGISRIQDRRYEEGEADLKEALQMRKALGNYIPRSGEVNLSWALLAQGKFEECSTLLLDSLAGREKALGKEDRESVRTGLIFMHLATSVLRKINGTRVLITMRERGATCAQRAMINRALDIWSVDPSAHKNEIARTTFMKGKLFEATGKTQKASIALRVARRLRKEITKDDRDVKRLMTEDFDELVAFWAR